MTYVDKIIKDKLNLFQIQKDLKEMLESNIWTSHFCHSSNDKMQSYSDGLENMKRRVNLSEIGYMSSVFSEDLALCLIKSCLEDNIFHIAKSPHSKLIKVWETHFFLKKSGESVGKYNLGELS